MGRVEPFTHPPEQQPRHPQVRQEQHQQQHHRLRPDVLEQTEGRHADVTPSATFARHPARDRPTPRLHHVQVQNKSGDDGRIATQTVQSGGATTHDVAPEQRGVLQQKQQGVRAREQSVE